MCTVSLIRWQDDAGDWRLRVGCNRDEQRSRPEALPPELRTFGRARAVLPIDSASRGTWLAANDAGVVFALLNRADGTQPAPPTTGRLSRGTIIPALLRHETAATAIAAAAHLQQSDYPPFRLVTIDAHGIGVLTGGSPPALSSRNPDYRPHNPSARVFTSSGLGDDLVGPPRTALFEQMAIRTPDEQDAFHRHVWPQATHLSVCMSRPDARTVSYTVMDVGMSEIICRYHPDPASTSDVCTVLLQRRAGPS